GARREVRAINLTDQERMKDIRKFVAEFHMPFPVLLDEKGRVRRLYALIGVPTSVFIGSDGVVRVVNPGPITKETLERGLAAILPARQGGSRCDFHHWCGCITRPLGWQSRPVSLPFR